MILLKRSIFNNIEGSCLMKKSDNQKKKKIHRSSQQDKDMSKNSHSGQMNQDDLHNENIDTENSGNDIEGNTAEEGSNGKQRNLKQKLTGISIELLKIGGILAICALLGIFLAVGNRKSSPYRYAEEYFSYFISNNYEKMYKMTDTRESDFINLENFKTKCAGERVYGSITGYKLSKPVKHGKYITYVATYYVGPEKEARTYTITLHKQKKNNMLFFDRWKVSVDRFLIRNYKVQVPVGTNVIMDGIDIKKYMKQTSSDGTTDIYIIKELFSGDHTVCVNLDATGEITKTQYVIKDNDSVSITTNDFAMKPDVQKNLFEYSTFVVKAMYEYAMDSTKNFEDISLLYASDDKIQKSAKNTFELISKEIDQPNGASLRQLNIQKLSPSIQSFTYPDKVVVRVDYSYDFTAIPGTSTLSGVVNEYTGSGNATSFVHLDLIDGAWKIVNVEISCVDYSNQG